ncbi:MAG: DUF2585 family protein [Paracoccaceae bacterium]
MTRSRALPFWITAGLIVATACILLWMGRVPICECGYVKLWHGESLSGENSQHLMDWYTPSHLLHGILFYAALWFAARWVSVGWRLVGATALECAWEIVENTERVIEHYRYTTVSADYFGDSVINSTADILVMMVGFGIALRVPIWVSVVTVIGFEVLTGFIIRDGLTLNIVMFLYPSETLKAWQEAM